jgi:hypothetical protein
MKSSSAYTNFIRVKAEATLLKVEFPGKIAVNQLPLHSATGCPSVLFAPITYTSIAKCIKPPVGGIPCRN